MPGGQFFYCYVQNFGVCCVRAGELAEDCNVSDNYSTMEYFLQEIVDATEYNALYCGHWHTEKQDGKIRFLFHDVIMLE